MSICETQGHSINIEYDTQAQETGLNPPLFSSKNDDIWFLAPAWQAVHFCTFMAKMEPHNITTLLMCFLSLKSLENNQHYLDSVLLAAKQSFISEVFPLQLTTQNNARMLEGYLYKQNAEEHFR